jgi:hypothetical protein
MIRILAFVTLASDKSWPLFIGIAHCDLMIGTFAGSDY